MSIPDYQSVMLPLLKLVADHDSLNMNKAVELIGQKFNLSNNELNERFPSGKLKIRSPVGWARTYLKKAGLLFYPERGNFALTERGRNVLLENPDIIDITYLKKYPEFLDFLNVSREDTQKTNPIELSLETPEEIMERISAQLKNQSMIDIIEKIKLCSYQFFENLVVDTIVKMGYGGSHKDAACAIGKSGDEGLDGVINEDRLGLDVIYLQAKRWEGNVSRPEIQKFAGALQGKHAKKGIFITTSDFTAEAREYVKGIDAKIILISGKHLAELMWEYNIGLSSSAIYHVKKLDLDYFTE